MKIQSAGILLYRRNNQALEFFLVHPGGPFWVKKDAGAWSIPKGEYDENESPIEAARREFNEETGFVVPDGELTELQPVIQKSGKVITAYAVCGDCDPDNMKSNLFSMEWPLKSGMQKEFPEADRGGWFTLDEAKIKINAVQVGLLEQFIQIIDQS